MEEKFIKDMTVKELIEIIQTTVSEQIRKEFPTYYEKKKAIDFHNSKFNNKPIKKTVQIL